MATDLEFRNVLDQITFGLVGTLEEKPYITDVQIIDCGLAKNDFIDAWEETNMCVLPADLKSFYLTMNGLLIEWSIEFCGKISKLGKVEVNAVESLVQISEEGSALSVDDIALDDLDYDNDQHDNKGHRKPRFSEKCFELSSEESYGNVCLVFKTQQSEKTALLNDAEIWFLDRSLQWHFLANSFRKYFRMLVIHLGIPGWQYLFTDIGLSPDSKQWFSLLLPHLTNMKEETNNDVIEHDSNKVDFNSLFKNKNNEKRKVDQSKQVKGGTTNKTKGSRAPTTTTYKPAYKGVLK